MRLKAAYSQAEFSRLVSRESDQVERKTGLSDRPLQEAMVALSNTDGGAIFVGVRDDGAVVGRQHDQGSDDRIHTAALTAREVGRYDIFPITVDGKPVIAIQIRRREEGFSQTSDGRVLVRRGARNVALYGADLARFIQERALRRFELATSGLSRTVADGTFLKEVASAHGWSARASAALDERLVERGLVRENELTVAGALFLTDPQASLRQNKATIEVRRYQSDGVDYDRRVQFGGPLHHQVPDATQFIMEELGHDLVVTGLYRHELPRIPEVVIREAIANAVAHRSYETHRAAIVVELRSDRVVVQSPGGLPEPVTVRNIRQAQAARNQTVIDVLRRFRLAEDAGRGVDVMEDTMQAALLDAPEFIDDGHAVRVVLSLQGPITARERAWVADLERRGEIATPDRLLLVHAARGEHVTNKVAREALMVGAHEAREALQRLRDSGLLVQHGQRGGAFYTIAEDLAPPAAYRMSSQQLEDLVVEQAALSPLSNERVRELTGFDRAQALTMLRRLVENGRLQRTGSRRGTRYTAL